MALSALPDNILDPDIFPTEKGPPHALFAKWRNEDPVHWNPANEAYKPNVPNSSMQKGFWVLTRYADVSEVSRDQERFSSYEEGFMLWDLNEIELMRQRANFMGMRPADHFAVKKVILPPFGPKALDKIAPEIERLAKEIVNDYASKGSCEFVFDVASKLPAYTFCELMGIPVRYRDEVVHLGNEIADVETWGDKPMDPQMRLFEIAEEISDLRRREPDDGMMTVIVNDAKLGLEQMSINVLFSTFAVAGHETTRSTAAHFIQLMSEFPEQYTLLKSDVDAHLGNAIEEVLRYTSATTNFRRTATCDTQIGGYDVKKGDKIYLSFSAANRDPAVFESPDKFDIMRSNARNHLAFGIGPHVCIGARLARLQLYALLKEIITRIPDIRVDGKPEWLRSIWFNAITRLPVTFTPE
jgi:cytochrome P450